MLSYSEERHNCRLIKFDLRNEEGSTSCLPLYLLSQAKKTAVLLLIPMDQNPDREGVNFGPFLA